MSLDKSEIILKAAELIMKGNMNIERLTQLAEWLEAGGDDQYAKFKMSDWYERESCGTIACMGGYTQARWMDVDGCYTCQAVGAELGLDDPTAARLFFPRVRVRGWDALHAKADWAARVVRNLIATGEVDWAKCC